MICDRTCFGCNIVKPSEAVDLAIKLRTSHPIVHIVQQLLLVIIDGGMQRNHNTC
jgi:hypothetical protein